MATQKESKVIRDSIVEQVASNGLENAEYIGRTTEGALFQIGEDYVAVRAIVKAETFDAMSAVEEYEEKQERAKQRAEEKKRKAEKRKDEKEKEKEE